MMFYPSIYLSIIDIGIRIAHHTMYTSKQYIKMKKCYMYKIINSWKSFEYICFSYYLALILKNTQCSTKSWILLINVFLVAK